MALTDLLQEYDALMLLLLVPVILVGGWIRERVKKNKFKNDRYE